MGTKGKSAAIVIGVVVLGALGWLILPAPEPRYHGETLSQFLSRPPFPSSDMYGGPIAEWSIRVSVTPGDSLYGPEAFSPPLREQEDAIRQCGVEALPTLLRLLRAQDSDLKLKLLKLAARKHLITFKPPPPAKILNDRASGGIQCLGSLASNAVPELSRICDTNISTSSRSGAIYALGGIGPAASNGVPALVRAARSPDFEIRIGTLWALGMIHARPNEVVPVLFTLMQDTNASVRHQAVYALGNFGPEAKAAVQLFLPLIGNLDPSVRSELVNDLRSIEPEFAAQLPEASAEATRALNFVVNHREAPILARKHALRELGDLHLHPETAVPALILALSDANIELQVETAKALGKFGTNAAQAVPALRQVLNDQRMDSNGVSLGSATAAALVQIVGTGTDARDQSVENGGLKR